MSTTSTTQGLTSIPHSASLNDLTTDATAALEEYKKKDGDTKVVIRFKATGNAPVMQRNFFKVTASQKFQFVIAFLRKELNWPAKDPLFLYVNSSFSPSPDDTISGLFKCFQVDKQLQINYSTTAAWG